MAGKGKPDGLQVSQDLEFQRKEWLVGRLGWIVLGILLILGLLGVFGGSGLLSTTTTGDPSQGFWITYDRFLRNLAPTTLTLFIEPGRIEGNTFNIHFPQDYIGEFEIQSIEPEPERVTVTSNGQQYTFNVQNPTGPIAIRFYLKAEKIGAYRSDVVFNGNQTLTIRQFSYP